jgi:preprotein translocase subunit SecG
MTILFTILHVIVCLFLILVVLAQQGKGQDLASAFGGAGSQTAFGARGTATLLSKITAGAAILFMVTSLMLSYLRPVTGQRTVVPDTPPPATGTESAPTTPPPPAEESTTTSPSEQPEPEPEAPEAPGTETGTEAAPATAPATAPAPAPEQKPASTTSAPAKQEPPK